MASCRQFLRSLWLFSVLMLSFTAADAKQAQLVIASDMPVIGDEKKGGYPQLASYLSQLRASPEPTFFIFGGGSLGPSPMSGFDRGAHIVDILNTLEPDAMGVSKPEFSYWEEELSLRSYEAAFPFVASNVFDPLTQSNLDGLEDHVIISRGELNIGLISILDPLVVEEYLLERLQIRDPELSIKVMTSKMRLAQVDSIVLLYSHPFPFISDLLNDGVIDLAVLIDPDYVITESDKQQKHPRNIVRTDYSNAIQVTYSWQAEDKSDLSLKWESTSLDGYDKREDVETQVRSYNRRLDRLLGEEIGVLNTQFDTLRDSVRLQESAFGNLVADSLRQHAKADVSIINGGMVRRQHVYKKGTVLTRGDIIKELPFRNRIALLELTGQQILVALENGFSQIDEVKGRFPQVSGMRVKFDSSGDEGERVRSVTIHGQPLDVQRLYTVATSAYLAGGGDGYEVFEQGRLISTGGTASPLISTIVINTIRRNRNLTPSVEGRLVNMKRQ